MCEHSEDSRYKRSCGLTGGACVNTLYSWLSHSSSSRIEATFPHLSHVLVSALCGDGNNRNTGTAWSRKIVTGSNGYDKKDAPVTVVRCTPDGDNCSIEHHLVAFHGQLMCSGDQIYGIVVNKLLGDVGAEEVSGTPRGYTPSFDV